MVAIARWAGPYNSSEIGLSIRGELRELIYAELEWHKRGVEDLWKIEPDMAVIGGDVVYSMPVEAN